MGDQPLEMLPPRWLITLQQRLLKQLEGPAHTETCRATFLIGELSLCWGCHAALDEQIRQHGRSLNMRRGELRLLLLQLGLEALAGLALAEAAELPGGPALVPPRPVPEPRRLLISALQAAKVLVPHLDSPGRPTSPSCWSASGRACIKCNVVDALGALDADDVKACTDFVTRAVRETQRAGLWQTSEEGLTPQLSNLGRHLFIAESMILVPDLWKQTPCPDAYAPLKLPCELEGHAPIVPHRGQSEGRVLTWYPGEEATEGTSAEHVVASRDSAAGGAP